MRDWLNVCASRIAGWFRPGRLEADFRDELRSHLDMLTDENLRRGMAPDAAARAARVRLGGTAQIVERHRDQHGLPWVDSVGQDVRYALRTFRRSPGFVATAVLVLAIGIGVNTTVFTFIDAVALKRLPIPHAGDVVRVERWFGSGARGDVQYGFSYDEYTQLRSHARLVGLIAVGWPGRLISEGEALHPQVVSDDYFSILGMSPALGRGFLPEENDEPGAHPVVVLSDRLWRRRFGGDPGAIGRTLALNGTRFTVVGVAPAGFAGTGNTHDVPDFWAPISMQPQLSPESPWLNRSDIHRLQLLGRIASGSSGVEAQAELETIASRTPYVAEPGAWDQKAIALTLQPATYFGGTDDWRFQSGITALMLLVGMVLFVACANLANMLLARGSARQKEIAIRLALGAGRRRVLRQLMTESLCLALLGGVAGLVVSVWAGVALSPAVETAAREIFNQPFVASLAPDWRVAAFAVGVSVAAAGLFGLSPALQLSKPDPGAALKDESSAFGSAIARSHVRSWLIAAQVAVSMVFLVCAGLLVRGLLHSRTADPGFDARRVYMVDVSLGTDPAAAPHLQERIVEQLAGEPMLQGVALIDRFPFGGTWSPPIIVDDARETGDRAIARTLANYVSSEYFQTLGVPMVRGRAFTTSETAGGARLAIVSAAAARRFWPHEDPIGKRLKLDTRFNRQFSEFEVVGVAGDVRSANLSRVDPAYVYLPTRSGAIYNLLIRSDRGNAAALAAVRKAIAAVDKALARTVSVTSIREGTALNTQLVTSKLLAACASVLACLALVLAAVGIYGVAAFYVGQRTREIGIRMALGARPAEVRRFVVRQAVGPVLAGSAAGLAASAGVASILRAMLVSPSSPDLLFGIRSFDPVTFLGIPTFLAMVAAFASYVPARRAVKVDPLVALRYE